MTNYIIDRVYTHKTFGELGKVNLEVSDCIVLLDGEELPEASVRAVLNHGLQIFQDAYAGAKNAADAKETFSAKLAKLLSGELSSRRNADPIGNRVRYMVAAVFRKKGVKGKARDLAVDAYIATAADSTISALREKAAKAIALEAQAVDDLPQG
jgi:hypothetical protein